MAFNSGFETRRKPSVQAVSEDRASLFFSDSQTSWVVFDQTELPPHDILSFSTENPLTSTEDESESAIEGDETSQIFQNQGQAYSGRDSSLHETDDELIDGLNPSLSHRINAWQKNTTETSVSDNVASWDLDEDLIHDVLDTTVFQLVPAYYGDHLFRNMSRSEYLRFRKCSAVLQKSLSTKGSFGHDPDMVSKLLSLIKWRDLLRSSGSLVDDYVANTLSRAHLQNEPVFKDTEFSDTATSSSLILCGGSGGAWNDL